MTSERRIAANRLNGPKSRGPRSAAGKSIASRNALRHGLAAINHRQRRPASDIERFARALCGDDNDPSLYEQALIIADNELVLCAIARQQLTVTERLRDPLVQALAKDNNILEVLDRRLRKFQQARDLFEEFHQKIIERFKMQGPSQLSTEDEKEMPEIDHLHIPTPPHMEEFLKKDLELSRERDETAALAEAARDLIRLDRYEGRAWSRQKRAIRAFMNIKLMKLLDPTHSKAP
jgi:hypothetical protein